MFLRFLSIYKDHLIANKKAIIISSIGLLFALGLIASSTIYTDSTRNIIFSKAIEDLSYTDEDISFNYWTSAGDVDNKLVKDQTNESITKYLNSTGIDSQIDRFYYKESINGFQTLITVNQKQYNSTTGEYYWENITYNRSVNLYELTPEIKNELQKLLLADSTFPIGINESLMLFVNNPQNTLEKLIYPDINANKSLTVPYWFQDFGSDAILPSLNYSLKGIAEIESKHLSFGGGFFFEDQIGLGNQNNGNNRDKDLLYPHLYSLSRNSYGDIYYFVESLSDMISFIGDIFDSNSGAKEILQYSLSGYLRFDYTNFDSYNLQVNIKKINQFTLLVQDDMNTKLGSGFNSYFSIYFQNQYVLEQAIITVELVKFNLFLYFIPILFVSLYLANYSYGLISRSLSKRIAIYKLRGLQNIHLASILILDSLLSLIIGLIGAMALGQLVTLLILKTNYILEFNNPENINLIFKPDNLLIQLFSIGLILSFLINVRRIFRFVNNENITFKLNTVQNPLWKKLYLDFVMTGFGYIAVFLYVESIKQFQNQYVQFSPFVFVGLLGALFTILGIILLIIRVYTFLLSKITTFSWNTFGGLFSLALKNVSNKFQQNTIKTIMILALVTATSIMFLTIPYSTVEWQEKNLEYEIGAEGRGTIQSPQNQLFNWSIINDLEANYSQYFESISPYFKFSLQSSGFSYNPADYGTILAINTSSYLKTVKMPVQLNTQNQDLSSLVDSIKTNNSDKLLLHKNNLNYRQTSIGENVTISGVDAEGKSKNLNYYIMDSFSFWPTLFFKTQGYGGGIIIDGGYGMRAQIDEPKPGSYLEPSYEDDLQFYGVVAIDKFVQVNASLKDMPLYQLEHGYYFNFNDTANMTAIAELLEENYNFNMRYLDQEIEDFKTDITFLVGVGQINANIVINMLIAFSLLVMFSIIIIIERKKSMLTEKTLGMRLRQTYRLLFYESLIVILSGLIIGNILGGLLSQLMSMFVTLGNATIEYKLLFPLDLIGNLELMFLFLAGIQILISIILVSRQKVSTTLLGDD